MIFGQVIVGPPGSGKSTYCKWVHELLNKLGRKTIVINLDPANHNLPYPCDINITSLITLNEAMKEYGLGPNGGIAFCMESLQTNLTWLENALKNYQDTYVLFDCPGQIELYTHHPSMKVILNHLTKLGHMLCVVQLVDALNCTDGPKYISCLFTSLAIMMQLELPHINVLSKLDLIESNTKLDFPLDYYTEVQDLSYLQTQLNQDPFFHQFHSFNSKLCELIEEYSLVSFLPLTWDQPKLVQRVLAMADKANGYYYGGGEHMDEVDKEKDIFDAWEQWQAEAVQEGLGGGNLNPHDPIP